jgi:hypothetical protein
MLEDILEIRKVNGIDVYFRKNDKQANNKPAELEKIIKYLTNEDFEDYKGKKYQRRLINPDNFEILDKYPKSYDLFDSDDETETFTCLCSENTCNHLMIIWHKPTNIYIAVGSVCYTRFNEENIVDVYHHCERKKCENCQEPLVSRTTKYTKNTNKKCDGKCFNCFEKKQKEEARKECNRVYLNVSYADKDDAKSLGAWWDAEKKKWYAPNSSYKYKMLIDKYL